MRAVESVAARYVHPAHKDSPARRQELERQHEDALRAAGAHGAFARQADELRRHATPSGARDLKVGRSDASALRAGALAGRRCTGHTHTHTHASDPPAPPLRPVAAGFSRRRGCCASGAAAAHGAVS